MKKQSASIGFLILVVASSLSAQNRSSASQVVSFGVKSSSARLVAGVLAASMTSSPSAGLKEASELQIPVSQLKKITYRFNGSTTGFSEIPPASRTSPRQRSVASLRGANDLVITITD